MHIRKLFLLLFVVCAARADKPAEVGFPWLAGNWRMTGDGADCDEIWSQPRGGTQFGAFRLIKEDETSFFEIFSIERDDEGMVLYMRHFSPGLVPWKHEAAGPTTWRLQGQGERRATFASESSSLTYRIDGDGRLVVTLAPVPADAGRVQTFTFTKT